MSEAVRVRNESAQEVLQLLSESGILDKHRRVLHEEGSVIFPILNTAKAGILIDIDALGGEVVPLSEDIPRTPFKRPFEEIAASLDLPDDMKQLLPRKWERHGDVLVLKMPEGLEAHKSEIAKAYADILEAVTVLNETGRISGQFREPEMELILGDRTEALHLENGIKYKFDAARIMFSSGNVDERIRMATVPDYGETIVDMFAGIGYFSIPMAVHSEPERIVSYEINPVSYGYLRENIALNGVDDTVCPVNSDCMEAEEEVADRVLMGYVGTTHHFLEKAIRILKNKKGMIHYHETCPEPELDTRPMARVKEAAEKDGRSAVLLNFKNIKSYGPGIYHVVLDVRIE